MVMTLAPWSFMPQWLRGMYEAELTCKAYTRRDAPSGRGIAPQIIWTHSFVCVGMGMDTGMRGLYYSVTGQYWPLGRKKR
jgi:hypothetical protein